MADYNATCDICGRQYKVCRSCQQIKTFQPWRTVTDTLPHYTIYLALVEYNRTKDKEKAKVALSNCDLSEKDLFNDNIKKVINEILKEDKNKEAVQKSTISVEKDEPQNNHFVKNKKVLVKKNIE